ncbi:TetR/AcrR family transcriptional regulator [Mycolicibacterium palauense]|uniref:TetR/AcrR family transcriptional regulator n=1 Tax=Mycolicibacterium palauense TaxID=2034511 RepID=UPI000BFF143F|nr:TetR/AcrR family transcriptional regulator [Mycolicibacterium palauense]
MTRGVGRPPGSSDGSGRDRLLDVARAEFGRSGFAATSVDDLARTAGVTTPTLYHHFGNKTGLFVAVGQDTYQRILGHFAEAAPPGTPFTQAFPALLKQSVDLMHVDRSLAMMTSTLQFELRRDPELAALLRPSLLEFRAFFDVLADSAPASLRAAPLTGRDLSRLLVALITGLGNEGLLLSGSEPQAFPLLIEAMLAMMRTAIDV